MANNSSNKSSSSSSSSSSQTTQKRNTSIKWVLNMLSFFALVLVGICLLLQVIFNAIDASKLAGATNAIRTVGECIAYCVIAVYAFFFIRHKKNPVWAVLYAIALTAILILIILR